MRHEPGGHEGKGDRRHDNVMRIDDMNQKDDEDRRQEPGGYDEARKHDLGEYD